MFGRGGPAPGIKMEPSFRRGEAKVVDSPRRTSRPASIRGSSQCQHDNGNVLTGEPPRGGDMLSSTPRGRRSSYERAPSEEMHPRIGRRPMVEPRHEASPYGKRTYSDRGGESTPSDGGSRGKGLNGTARGGGEWFSQPAPGSVSSPGPRQMVYHPSRGIKNNESNLTANREINPSKRVLKTGVPSLVGVLQAVPQSHPKKAYRPTAPFYTADE